MNIFFREMAPTFLLNTLYQANVGKQCIISVWRVILHRDTGFVACLKHVVLQGSMLSNEKSWNKGRLLQDDSDSVSVISEKVDVKEITWYLDTDNELPGDSLVTWRQVLQAYRQFRREIPLFSVLLFLLVRCSPLHQILQRIARWWINEGAPSTCNWSNGAYQGGRGIGTTEMNVVGIPGIPLDRACVLVDRAWAIFIETKREMRQKMGRVTIDRQTVQQKRT